jgi:hypothetical protein
MPQAFPGQNLIAGSGGLKGGRAVKLSGTTLVYAASGDENIAGITLNDAPAGLGVTIVPVGEDCYVDLGATVGTDDISLPLAPVGSEGKLGPWDGVTGAACARACQAGGNGDRRRAVAFFQFPPAANGGTSS